MNGHEPVTGAGFPCPKVNGFGKDSVKRLFLWRESGLSKVQLDGLPMSGLTMLTSSDGKGLAQFDATDVEPIPMQLDKHSTKQIEIAGANNDCN